MNFVKTGKQWRSKGSTELYCLFIAADSIADAIGFVRRIVLDPKNELSPNLAPAPAGFEFLDLARSGSGRIWNTQIWYSPKYKGCIPVNLCGLLFIYCLLLYNLCAYSMKALFADWQSKKLSSYTESFHREHGVLTVAVMTVAMQWCSHCGCLGCPDTPKIQVGVSDTPKKLKG